MKKAVSLVLALCLALLLAVPAFADGRGPTFTSYDVVCTKETPYYQENWDDDDDVEDGVMEKKGAFPAGTKLTVDYEYDKDGVLYGSVRVGDDDEDVEWFYIRLSDVKLQNDVYLPQNEQKLPEPRSVRVIEKGGVPLYAGPNKQYDVVSNIPRGTKLTYEYSNDEDDAYRTWAYVSYFGKEGWIYVYRSDTKNGVAELPDKDEKTEIWVLADDVKLYDGISFGNIEDEFDSEYWNEDYIKGLHEEPDRVIGTLEKGKKYPCKYSHGSDFGEWYYVTAGLRSGWAFASNGDSRVAATPNQKKNDLFLTYRAGKLNLRPTPDENAAGTAVSVAKDVTLDPEYEIFTDDGTFYYDTIDGQSGWFSLADAGEFAAYKWNAYEDGRDLEDTNESEQPAPIYGDVMRKDKTVGKVPVGGTVTLLYRGDYETKIDEENSEYVWFYYVDYKGVNGWVFGDDLYRSYAENAPEEDERDDSLDDEVWEGDGYWDGMETDTDAQNTPEEETAEETQAAAETAVSVSHSSLSPLQIVLICVGGAAVLALTAAVTLTLIRRKRKAKPQPAPETETTQAFPTPDDDETQELR